MTLYKDLYVRELLLPPLPTVIQEKINWNYSEYQRQAVSKDPNYTWSDNFNADVNEWCQQNIAPGIYYAFQLARDNMPMHKDNGTITKFLYILDAGGDDVYTEFFKEDAVTLLHKEKLELHKWYIIRTDINHRVIGITPPRVRFSITARLFKTID